MKPYYEHAGITIYHGDCREILPQLVEDSIDLIVTDPPYGVQWESNYRQKSFGAITGDHSKEAGEVALGLCMPLLRNRRHAYVFGQFDFAGLPISDVVELIWDKGNIGGGDLSLPWAKQHEYIQFFASCKSWKNYTNGQGRLTARLRKGSILSHPRLNALQVADHPTEKPIMLLRELIESSSRFDELILDPFMGSGSCAQAAALEGRKFCGIEIEEKYCEIAAKRLSQEVFQFAGGEAEGK